MTLVEFLLDRILEDEGCALAASDHAAGGPYRREWARPFSAEIDPGSGASFNTNDRDIAAHIERFDPARMLAECDAKREFVEGLGGSDMFARRNPTLPTLAREWLKMFALPYADHPDYREEWRP